MTPKDWWDKANRLCPAGFELSMNRSNDEHNDTAQYTLVLKRWLETAERPTVAHCRVLSFDVDPEPLVNNLIAAIKEYEDK